MQALRDSSPTSTLEPRWPALIAVLAAAGIYLALPPALTIGPRWVFPAAVGMLLVPTVLSHYMGRNDLNRRFGIVLTALITVQLVGSVLLLIRALPVHQETPTELLSSAVSLWVTNVLAFSLWYWRLDAGGPHQREAKPGHTEGAFLFPQMAVPPEIRRATGQQLWSPNFIDYLFLSFNTSTAFSPTDTAVLTRWGKILMMIQSTISLTVLALLAARAVNIL